MRINTMRALTRQDDGITMIRMIVVMAVSVILATAITTLAVSVITNQRNAAAESAQIGAVQQAMREVAQAVDESSTIFRATETQLGVARNIFADDGVGTDCQIDQYFVEGDHDNGYRLRRHASPALRDVFMHLLRNSVDHGIEPADARMAAGKQAAGAIEIEVGVDAGALQITLSDDGRGLALARIRAIAAERGWVGPHDDLADETVANFIFRAGFSTANAVTEVSGRGVGMDAVKDRLEREHGRIELRFTDDRRGADFRRFQTIVHLPESWVVDSLGAPVGQGEPAAPKAKPAHDGALT